MNLSYGVTLPSSPRMIPSNGVTLPSSSRMSLSNGMHDNLDDRVLPIQRLNRVRDLKSPIQNSHSIDDETFPNSSEPIETINGVPYSSELVGTINWAPNYSSELKDTISAVSDADFYEHFETWSKKYGKTYSSDGHKQYRFKLFKDNYPINPPDKSYLSLHFLDEKAAADHPNGYSHRLDPEEALRKYGFRGCSLGDPDFFRDQPGTMYLHKIGCRQPFIVPLDSDLGNILNDSVFFERYEIVASNLNSWKTEVTESMTKGNKILNFPRSISRRFLTHNPCFIKVIDRESGTHFPCLVKSSGRDVHDQFIYKGWDDFVRSKRVKEGDSLIFAMAKNGRMMLVQTIRSV